MFLIESKKLRDVTFKNNLPLTRNQQNVNKLLVVNLIHKISLNSMTHNFTILNLHVTRHSNRACFPIITQLAIQLFWWCSLFELKKFVAFLLAFFFQVELKTIFHSVKIWNTSLWLHFRISNFFLLFFNFYKFTTP